MLDAVNKISGAVIRISCGQMQKNCFVFKIDLNKFQIRSCCQGGGTLSECKKICMQMQLQKYSNNPSYCIQVYGTNII